MMPVLFFSLLIGLPAERSEDVVVGVEDLSGISPGRGHSSKQSKLEVCVWLPEHSTCRPNSLFN